MNLFQLNDTTFNVEFAPQALLLKPFREIWDCDMTEGKQVASAELAYVYYMCDQRSDHMYILDEQERHEVVVDALNLGQGWTAPPYVENAMLFYKEMSTTVSTKLLTSTRGVVEKISKFLDDIDPNERDKNNKPVFDINKIVASVEKIPKLVKSLNQIEEEVIKEKELKSQNGNRDMGMFDDTGI